ncbi:MAG: branched-chain amino acid transaminase [Deltaproteobacteria bacterium]|nr:branched-chain amino acid transaminase [Deltaproteobacteria bacterium]MCB9785217.1 branched-chain amino acid transaminase [Deltaproteobacteria bacterium]
MVTKADTIWFDGELRPWDSANVHILTHTLHYGLGVFEGIRVYRRADGQSAVFRLREHIERLVDGARMMTIPVRYSVDELMAACVETCRSNGLAECYVRPIAFIGEGAMGVAAMENPTHVAIAAWPWGAYLGDEGLARGVRLKTSTFVRPHINSQLHKGKVCGHYVNSILAKREALLDGYDEALMLDTQGYVSEASGENIFCVRRGEIYTPPYGSAILGGITRHTLLTLAGEAGLRVREEPLTRDMLYLADEVFMCGTAAEVTPVRELDRRVIGSGSRGPVTETLQARYFDVVKGSDDSHPQWFTRFEVAGR